LALYKDIKVGKYAISELYVIIGLTAVSERLLDTFTEKAALSFILDIFFKCCKKFIEEIKIDMKDKENI
jgi:hypothetical protein